MKIGQGQSMKVKLLWLFSILFFFFFYFLPLIAAQHRGRMSRYLWNNEIAAWNWTKVQAKSEQLGENDDGYLDSVLHPLGVLQRGPGQSCPREERRAHPQNHSHEWYAFEVKKIFFFFYILSFPLLPSWEEEGKIIIIIYRHGSGFFCLCEFLYKSLRKKRKGKEER